jgi:magnesium-transporting ATPase (P-type)
MEQKIKAHDDLSLIHKITIDEVYSAMDSRSTGLTTDEFNAKQEKYGKNVVSEKKEKPLILVFLSNFISMMAILLWVGGLVAFIAAMPELGIAIWLVNVINGVFSFWQEFRAGKATEA